MIGVQRTAAVWAGWGRVVGGGHRSTFRRFHPSKGWRPAVGATDHPEVTGKSYTARNLLSTLTLQVWVDTSAAETERRPVVHQLAPASEGDTATLPETLITAAEQVELVQPDGRGVEEMVADKGYHSDETLVALGEVGVRSYVSEPERGQRLLAGQEDGRDAAGEACCAECRAFFGWRRGGHRPKVTGRVTAPLTEKWIGRNRCPDARLWALHGREALLARGLPVVRGRCRLTAVGDDAYEGLPAAVGRGRRRKSTGPALRDQQEAAPGGLGWARHDESRKAGRPQASAKWSTACMFPSWHRGHRRNERPVNAS